MSSFIFFKSRNKPDWEQQEVTLCKQANPYTKSEPSMTYNPVIEFRHAQDYYGTKGQLSIAKV